MAVTLGGRAFRRACGRAILIGSQYLFATLDADKRYFGGAKTYKLTLPKGISEAKFWSSLRQPDALDARHVAALPSRQQRKLSFALRRTDVLPTSDLGVRIAIRKAYQLPELPKPAEIEELARPWRPYCSVAAWYLWRSLD